jgi:hypothetical protein
LLFFVLATYAQEQKRVAILNTEDNGEQSLEFTDLIYLTDRLREIAGNTLPGDKYFVMTTQSIIDKMGSKENARKVCKEAQCMAEIGRKISADYIGQARLGRFGGNLTISMELYHSARGNLIGSFTGNAKEVFGLLTVIDEKAPSVFRKMPDVPSGVQVKETDYKSASEKRYLANISSDPEGASLSFNGVIDARCTKTPCSVELREGNVRFIAELEKYEIADTTVSINQNNQNIHIRMKSNEKIIQKENLAANNSKTQGGPIIKNSIHMAILTTIFVVTVLLIALTGN